MGSRWGNSGNSVRLYFRGSKITADGDGSHKIKRRLLHGRKAMTNLDSMLKSRDISLPTKVRLVKAMVFLVVLYGCESWTKYWSFSLSIIPSKEIPGLISFRMDWLDLLAVQGTLKSLLQHHSSKASVLRHSVFFTVQLSYPYMTTGKTIALTRWTRL